MSSPKDLSPQQEKEEVLRFMNYHLMAEDRILIHGKMYSCAREIIILFFYMTDYADIYKPPADVNDSVIQRLHRAIKIFFSEVGSYENFHHTPEYILLREFALKMCMEYEELITTRNGRIMFVHSLSCFLTTFRKEFYDPS